MTREEADCLHPVVVAYLLDLLTPSETKAMFLELGAPASLNDVDYTVKASAWLRKRFAGLSVLSLTLERGKRMRKRARWN